MPQQRRSDIAPNTHRSGRVLGGPLVALLMVLTSLPLAPAALAGHPTPPEAASLQPQERPTATPTPTPSEEETKLANKKKILQLQKDIADLEKGIREDNPQPSATPLEGKTTLDENAIIE